MSQTLIFIPSVVLFLLSDVSIDFSSCYFVPCVSDCILLCARHHICEIVEMFEVWDNAIFLQRGFMCASASYLGAQTLKVHIKPIYGLRKFKPELVSRSAYF